MTAINLLQKLYLDRATSFLAKLQNANIVKHGPTVGDLREQAIIESLSELIPTTFDISSGFVIDARGTVTPQIDVLFYQKGTLSPLLLTERSVLLPIELFRFGIEVKSTITRSTFDQVKAQANSLASLWNSAWFAGNPPISDHITISFQKLNPPFLLVAASSDLSRETLEDELNDTKGLTGIIVFDRCIIYKNGGSYEGTSDIDRVIRFWTYIFNHCIDLSEYVSVSPKKEQELIAEIQGRHPELDTSLESTREMILEKLRTPSLIPYLYPDGPKGVA